MNAIACPPPEPREPMSERARQSADYALDAVRRGVVSMEDALKLRVVQRRLEELGKGVPVTASGERDGITVTICAPPGTDPGIVAEMARELAANAHLLDGDE